MRLTLRTMLAYLDDVLSEADAHELGSKIDSSDFATGLVHRIRSSISRLRLSSPELLGSDSMDDPNTVAEFIDSSLSPEKEQEFEKVCLQSDKHLAEVASSHQILSLVLGTPARVDPRLRDRVYRTGIPGDGAVTPGPSANGGRRESFRRIDAVASTARAGASAQTGPVEIQTPRRIEDPKTAMAGLAERRNFWPIVAAVLLGFLLTGGFLVAMGPLDNSHPLAGILGLQHESDSSTMESSTDLVVGNTPLSDQQTAEPAFMEIPPKNQDMPPVFEPGVAAIANTADSAPEFDAPAFDAPTLPAEPFVDSTLESGVPAFDPTVPQTTDALPVSENSQTQAWQEPASEAAASPWDIPEASPLAVAPAPSSDNGSQRAEDRFPGDLGEDDNGRRDSDDLFGPATTNNNPASTQSSPAESPTLPAGPLETDPALAASDPATTLRNPFAREPRVADSGGAVELVPEEVEASLPPTPDSPLGIPGIDEPLAAAGAVEATDSPIARVAEANTAIPEPPRRTTPVDVEQPKEVGRYLSEGQILLYRDEQASTWLRLPPRTQFGVGHRLRTLKNYHPQLLLAPGNVQVTSRGNSEIVFVEPMDAETATLEIPYGRLMLNTTNREGSRIALQTNGRRIVIEFSEPDTEVVCEVRAVLLTGLDPRQESPHRIVRCWVTRGAAMIGEEGSEPQRVDMGNQFGFADQRSPLVVSYENVPSWLQSRIGEVDRAATAELESLLPLGRDVVLSLTEMADSRRTDVRNWAIRHLVALGEYRVGAALFSVADRKHQLTWPALFAELRSSAAQNADTANAIHKVFQDLFAADGERLYRLLLGFDNQQLKAGAAEQLVADLDHPRVEFRILAIQNLSQMTGKTLLYGPVQSDKHRSSKVSRWKNELKKGKVTMIQVPEELAAWKRLTAPSVP